MDLFSGVVYYVGVFIVSVICIVAGCFVGANLRKRKDAKVASLNDEEIKKTIEQ